MAHSVRFCGHGKRRSASLGFTLIEIMIVVAVIAILAAVALPSYFDSIRKGRRADAITLVNRTTQEQERWRANNPTFSANIGANGLLMTTAVTAVTTTGTLSCSNFNASGGYYRVQVCTDSLANANQVGYAIVATAIGSQASDSRCTSLTLTMGAAGTVAYTSSGTATPAQCWNR
jgi:type IV pilus assembly protein PilE